MQAAQSLVLLEGKLEQLASKLALTQQRSDLQSEAFHEERKRLHRQVRGWIVLYYTISLHVCPSLSSHTISYRIMTHLLSSSSHHTHSFIDSIPAVGSHSQGRGGA